MPSAILNTCKTNPGIVENRARPEAQSTVADAQIPGLVVAKGTVKQMRRALKQMRRAAEADEGSTKHKALGGRCIALLSLIARHNRNYYSPVLAAKHAS